MRISTKGRCWWPLLIAAGMSWGPVARSARAQQPVSGAPTTHPASTTTASAEVDPRDWFVKPRARSTWRDTEPPNYVRPLDQFDWPGTAGLDWLEFGIEHRSRYRHLSDNYLNDLRTDDLGVMRSRAYVGVRKILDPLRFGFEFQDSRQFGAKSLVNGPSGNRLVNENDILQAFAELYFADLFDEEHPVSLRVGRMAAGYIDRRLVSRNRFRNTTNAFDGFRFRIGERTSDWQLDVFAMQPVERRLTRPDRTDEERWLYGVSGGWRRWSEIVTLEPYYFILDSDYKDPATPDSTLHTMGLHAYGPGRAFGPFYDLDFAFQFGPEGQGDHRAFALHGELGYAFDLPWRPRLSAWINYASGDREPADADNERFDSLFGSSHGMYGFLDTFNWANMIDPAVRFTTEPTDKLRFEAIHRFYWLASRKDAWIRPGRVDPTGQSGRWVGQETDLLIRYEVTPRLWFEMGYAHFWPGSFVDNTGSSEDSDMFYIQTTLRL